MKDNEIKLKRCPKCGGEAHMEWSINSVLLQSYSFIHWTIKCEKCGFEKDASDTFSPRGEGAEINLPTKERDTLIAWWNERAHLSSEWERVGDKWLCKQCHETSTADTEFCPHCGAEMHRGN